MKAWIVVVAGLVVGCGVSEMPTIDLTVTEWCSGYGCGGPDHFPECDADGFCTCDGLVCYEPTCKELGCTSYDCTDAGDVQCVCETETAGGTTTHDVLACLHGTEPRL